LRTATINKFTDFMEKDKIETNFYSKLSTNQKPWHKTYFRSLEKGFVEVPFRFRLFTLNQFNINWRQEKYRPGKHV